jgi:hypothetical protein
MTWHCYKDRLEIATNASVVTEALSQVEKMMYHLQLVTIIFVFIGSTNDPLGNHIKILILNHLANLLPTGN